MVFDFKVFYFNTDAATASYSHGHFQLNSSEVLDEPRGHEMECGAACLSMALCSTLAAMPACGWKKMCAMDASVLFHGAAPYCFGPFHFNMHGICPDSCKVFYFNMEMCVCDVIII